MLPATQLSRLIANGELSPSELLASCLEKIEQDDHGAFINVAVDQARREALMLTEEGGKTGPRGPLHGIPVAIKASIAVAGLPHTVGSGHRRIIADRDAEVVRRLREAGAVILGTLNMHEWAWGITNANPFFGTPVNPAAPEHSPGGSSGGNAVAVAAGLVPLTLGADAAGSIRLPAAYCGIVGNKPAFNLVPTAGDYPLCPSLGHVGPMTQTVADARLLLEAVTGGRYPASPGPVRVGLIAGYETDLALPGVEITTVAVPAFRAAPAACSVISLAEAAGVHHAQLARDPSIYGADVLTRLRAGQEITAEDLADAEQTRRELIDQFAEAFRHVDALITRTTPEPAPRLADAPVPGATRLLVAANLTGHPAVSVPAGRSRGRPVGLQVIAEDDATVLAVAEIVEHAYAPGSCRGER